VKREGRRGRGSGKVRGKRLKTVGKGKTGEEVENEKKGKGGVFGQ
jgi:hypothetical protein